MKSKSSSAKKNETDTKNTFTFDEVFEEEKEYIRQRRKRIEEKYKVSPEVKPDKPDNEEINDLFGIALSGGGIRSATLNMGFLNFLNDHGILKLADYISSVSGGGFIHGYVQSKLNKTNDFEKLFQKSGKKTDQNYGEHIINDNEVLRENCDYLIPGSNWFTKFANYIRVYGAIAASFLMNLFWLASLIILILFVLKVCIAWIGFNSFNNAIYILLGGFTIVVFYHYFLYFLRDRLGWSSDILNYFEGFILAAVLISTGLLLISSFVPLYVFDKSPVTFTNGSPFIRINEFLKELPQAGDLTVLNFIINFLIWLFVFVIIGFFANPNILSLHRYYRDRIAGAFIKPFLNQKNRRIKLFELINDDKSINPYPLINSCMNIKERKRKNKNITLDGKKIYKNIYGIETADYFMLSPKFCGSSLTGYASTKKDYKDLTFSTAVAASGSAVNTLMGNRTNRFIALFIYLFNAVLGYWMINPNWRRIKFFNLMPSLIKNDFMIKYFTFWPYYLWKEMQGKADHYRGRVNISDGGHIENLGVFELLKRRCKLIIAFDASADPNYEFCDLTNLVIRAREKLGLEITFTKRPEDIIKPCPSSGFSTEHFVIGTIKCLPGTPNCSKNYKGKLIYIKSSLKASKNWKDEGGPDNKDQDEANAFNYKINHPSFPHDTTINQFFDPDQWDAYYFLGRKISESVFLNDGNCKFNNLDNLMDYVGNMLKISKY